jgi:hypothetical protein
MQIQWHGLGCFSLSGKSINDDVGVVLDPFGAKFGVKPPKGLRASIVVSSHDGEMANSFGAVVPEHEGEIPFFVKHAGEYEVKGVFVNGIHAPLKDGTGHTIYRIAIEGMSIGYLGALDRLLKEKEIEALGDINILILPVGGGSVLSASQATEVVAQVEPRLVIPSHFAIDGLELEWANHEVFCREVACPRKDESKLKIVKSGLPIEDMELIVLSKV